MILIQHTSLALLNFKQSKTELFQSCRFFFSWKLRFLSSIINFPSSLCWPTGFRFPPCHHLPFNRNLNDKKIISSIYDQTREKVFSGGFCKLFFGLPVIKLRIPSLHQWQINWKFDSVSVRKRMFLIFNPTLISSENFPIAMEFLLTGLLSNVSAELLTFFLTIATISDYKREKSFETFLPDSLIQIMATLWIQFPLRIFSGFLALWLTMKRVES